MTASDGQTTTGKRPKRLNIPLTVQRRVFRRQRSCCYYCGIPLEPPKRLGIEARVCCLHPRYIVVTEQGPVQYNRDFCIRGELEHKTPLRCGGTDAEENLSWACSYCNSQKGLMTAEDFGDLRGLTLKERAATIQANGVAWSRRLWTEQPSWWLEREAHLFERQAQTREIMLGRTPELPARWFERNAHLFEQHLERMRQYALRRGIDLPHIPDDPQ